MPEMAQPASGGACLYTSLGLIPETFPVPPLGVFSQVVPWSIILVTKTPVGEKRGKHRT